LVSAHRPALTGIMMQSCRRLARLSAMEAPEQRDFSGKTGPKRRLSAPGDQNALNYQKSLVLLAASGEIAADHSTASRIVDVRTLEGPDQPSRRVKKDDYDRIR